MEILSEKNKPNHGFPVLACASPSGSTTPWLLCSLLFKHSQKHNEASILLHTSVDVDGFEAKQDFIFQYDSDNLVPGTGKLGPASADVPESHMSQVLRDGSMEVKSLPLTFKATCPVWYSRAMGEIPPRSLRTTSHQIVELANSPTVQILLDLNWLHKDHKLPFARFFSEQLSGFPVHHLKLFRTYNRVDWPIFSSIDNAGCPPPYAEVSHKRPRQTSSPSPYSPPRKRILDEVKVPTYHPGSATEVNTPTTVDEPSFLNSGPNSSPGSINHDFKHNAVRVGPASNHQSTNPIVTDLQYDAISRALSQHLPIALEEVLTRLLTAPPPPSTISTASDDLNIPHINSTEFEQPPPPPPPLTQLGAALMSQLVPHALGNLRSIHEAAHHHAQKRRVAADRQFFAQLDEAKQNTLAEMDIAKDDALDDIRAETSRMSVEAEEKRIETVELVTSQLETVGDEVYETIRQKVEALERVTCSWCSGEIQEAMSEKHSRVPRRRPSRMLGKGGYRGLGRR